MPASTLRFDDVLAGRLLARQAPALRERLLEHLDAMARGDARRSLLGELVAGGHLGMEPARAVQRAVERYRAGRGVGVLVELASREGVSTEALQEHARRLGPAADPERLGAALVAAGVLDAPAEERLRFQARVALERDLTLALERFVDGRRAAGALSAPVDDLAPPGSAMFRADLPLPSREEARRIVDKNLSSAVTRLFGPRFRVPPWVDTGDPAVGTLIDRYRVVGRIGHGGSGVVYLTFREDEPARPWALKVLERGAKPHAVGRFKREALASSLFSHRSALEVDGAGCTPAGQHFLAVEFFDGRDLGWTLHEHGPLPARAALLVARQVLEVLEAAHAQGIIHRDVKPENILVSHDLARARLIDFGIALLGSLGEFTDRVFHTAGPDVVGSPRYMSPEQCASQPLAPTTDLYSLGLVIYEALSGATPFEAEGPLAHLKAHIVDDPRPLAQACPEAAAWPAALHALVGGLLAKDPEDRPQTARAVIDALDRVLVELPPEQAAEAQPVDS
jgi:serine/threonine-protein kinase